MGWQNFLASAIKALVVIAVAAVCTTAVWGSVQMFCTVSWWATFVVAIVTWAGLKVLAHLKATRPEWAEVEERIKSRLQNGAYRVIKGVFRKEE